MNYFTSILSHEKPLKFLTAKILIKTNLCRFFTIRQSHYTLKFFPTALSQNKWINQNYVHAADDPFLQHYIKNGDKIIDVGANIGTVTLLASALIGNSGTVYSIEPHPNSLWTPNQIFYITQQLQNMKWMLITNSHVSRLVKLHRKYVRRRPGPRNHF